MYLGIDKLMTLKKMSFWKPIVSDRARRFLETKVVNTTKRTVCLFSTHQGTQTEKHSNFDMFMSSEGST